SQESSKDTAEASQGAQAGSQGRPEDFSQGRAEDSTKDLTQAAEGPAQDPTEGHTQGPQDRSEDSQAAQAAETPQDSQAAEAAQDHRSEVAEGRATPRTGDSASVRFNRPAPVAPARRGALQPGAANSVATTGESPLAPSRGAHQTHPRHAPARRRSSRTRGRLEADRP